MLDKLLSAARKRQGARDMALLSLRQEGGTVKLRSRRPRAGSPAVPPRSEDAATRKDAVGGPPGPPIDSSPDPAPAGEVARPMPRLLSLPKLRECLADARAFSVVSGDRVPERYIEAAITAAERYEPDSSFKVCLCCQRRHQRRSDYCSFECAEEDGAIEK